METSVSPDRFSSSLDLGGVSCFSVPRFACSSGQVAAVRQRGGTTAIGIKLLEESTCVFDSMLVGIVFAAATGGFASAQTVRIDDKTRI